MSSKLIPLLLTASMAFATSAYAGDENGSDGKGYDFYQLSKELMDNELRVRVKYDGKPISGFGEVFDVADHLDTIWGTPYILVRLNGPYAELEEGGQSSEYMWQCVIEEGSPAMDTAILLDKGQKVSVSGTVKYISSPYTVVKIEDCVVTPKS